MLSPFAGSCQNTSMVKLLLFLSFFLSLWAWFPSAHAQTNELNFDAKQQRLLERLEVLDAQGQKKLNSKRLAPLNHGQQGKANRVQAAIMKGALLTDQQGINYYSKKFFYVWGIIYEQNPYLFLVTNEQGDILYQTHTRYVVPIKNDLSLDPEPQIYQEVVHKPNRYTYDPSLKLEIVPHYGLETFSFESAKSYTGRSGGQSMGQRLGAEVLFKLPFPIKPGMLISAQNGMGEIEGDSYSYSFMDIGPTVKIRLARHFDLKLQAGKSLFFRATFDQQNGEAKQASYDATFWGAGIDYQFRTSWRPLIISALYRLYQLRPAESYETIDASNRGQNNTQIGVYLGLPLEFSL